ncbi:hypothetical protein JCM9140_1898 [Halalkalibacter wakoensis JCM 9140]|uniref:Uncharacterized protein n=1 Tax=Halalkalibacter wakoensis JCM 9140 TaxID=1236970 RepID=W4Q1N0_9BACI|nr:hypothetical protein [Halalkalibacter wakoensis]GAE25877.1 hypothetical protein JCM9140_1898 [Halalkalibacter wakoensis JCM 9140]
MSHSHNMKVNCQQYLHQPVQVQLGQQQSYSGVIEHVDDHNVYLMVPIDEMGQYMDLATLMQGANAQSMYHYGQGDQAFDYIPQDPMARQQAEQERYFAGGGYFPPYPPFPVRPPFPYYPYPYGPFPRPLGWGRIILPLAALTAIAALV